MKAACPTAFRLQTSPVHTDHRNEAEQKHHVHKYATGSTIIDIRTLVGDKVSKASCTIGLT